MFYTCDHSENKCTFAISCKAMAGLKQKCQVYSGQNRKICKEILGRVKNTFNSQLSTLNFQLHTATGTATGAAGLCAGARPAGGEMQQGLYAHLRGGRHRRLAGLHVV